MTNNKYNLAFWGRGLGCQYISEYGYKLIPPHPNGSKLTVTMDTILKVVTGMMSIIG